MTMQQESTSYPMERISQVLKCDISAIGFRESHWGRLLQHGENYYRVVSAQKMGEECERILSDPDYAEMMVPVFVAIEIAEGIHREYEFFEEADLTTQDEILFLRALEISKLYDDNDAVFWLQIERNAPHLMGILLCAMARVWSMEACAMELEESLWNSECFCERANGVNEMVSEDDEDPDKEIFYLFQVTEETWNQEHPKKPKGKIRNLKKQAQ